MPFSFPFAATGRTSRATLTKKKRGLSRKPLFFMISPLGA